MLSFGSAVIYCYVLSFVTESISGNPLGGETHHPFNAQYHSQGSQGQYKYGYSTAQSAKEESRSADGTTRGSYSFVDANGVLQTVSYIADAVNGFKILPNNQNAIDSEMQQNRDPSKRQHSSENTVSMDDMNNNPSQIIENPTPYSTLNLPGISPSDNFNQIGNTLIQLYKPNPYLVQSPFPDAAVVPTILPGVPTYGPYPVGFDYHQVQKPGFYPLIDLGFGKFKQYHSQNALGHYSYGYANEHSSKDEVRGSDGVTRGAYSYIDANGKLQTVSYTADAKNGFRVIATNLPVGPSATRLQF